MNSRPFEIEKAFRKNYTMLDHIVNVFTIWSPLKLSNHMIGVLKGSYGEPVASLLARKTTIKLF